MNSAALFDMLGKRDDETSIDYARRLLDDLYTNDARPWIVCYSAGKDSTLTLQLVCEVQIEHGFKKPMAVIFNDTGYECGGKVERVKSVFQRINDAFPEWVETHILKPKPTHTVLVHVVGLGYPIPQPQFRYCTKYLKAYVADCFEHKFTGVYGGAVRITGVRKEESTNRKSYLTLDRAPDYLKIKSYKYNIAEFRPIADVKTDELWKYLESVGTFCWGETIEELRELYPDQSISQRDGCWICTVASESSFNNKQTTEGQTDVRRYLRVIQDDPCKRCLPNTPKQREWFKKGKASGRFTLEARKEAFDFIRGVEKHRLEKLLSDVEIETIQKCWRYCETTGEMHSDLSTILRWGNE